MFAQAVMLYREVGYKLHTLNRFSADQNVERSGEVSIDLCQCVFFVTVTIKNKKIKVQSDTFTMLFFFQPIVQTSTLLKNTLKFLK